MKAYVFSIGEKTTDLCCELMREYGFDVILYRDSSTLWDKLKRFYLEAYAMGDEVVSRVDADIIPNRNIASLEATGWECAVGYDWYSQDRKAISFHVMTRKVVRLCLDNIESARHKTRPETHLWRLPEINPLTTIRDEFSCGLHGYGQMDQRERIKALKHVRGQEYDWELLDKIEALK